MDNRCYVYNTSVSLITVFCVPGVYRVYDESASSSITVTIEIDDNNDHAPEFSQTQYEFYLFEEAQG